MQYSLMKNLYWYIYIYISFDYLLKIDQKPLSEICKIMSYCMANPIKDDVSSI